LGLHRHTGVSSAGITFLLYYATALADILSAVGAKDLLLTPLDMQVNTCILWAVESDAVFKALADRTRRRLLDLLHEENGQTLGALCEHMDMTRQGVTQHLAILEAANLVAVVWHGREKLHYLNPVPLFEVYERWIEKFERGRLRALRDLKKTLEADKNE
jgi:DNA-binding transcriptional ArsR family regulator